MFSRMGVFACVMLMTCGFACGQGKVGSIEFYGGKEMDLPALRGQLPLHSGDVLEKGWKDEVKRSVLGVTGAEPTDVAAICCDELHARTVFIGLRGATFRPLAYVAAPTGHEALPPEVFALYGAEEQALKTAVESGDAGEDDTQGYSLATNPTLRGVQMKMRAYAVEHTRETQAVLEHSGNVGQRRAASEILGYADASAEQVSALVHAVRDPDSDVRNNAVRALLVLLAVRSEYIPQVDPSTVFAMLYSGTWTDRNKGAHLLEVLTRSRDAHLLQAIHERAWDPLVEMARWRDAGHAYPCRVILGRVTGIPEVELQKRVWKGTVDEIMAGILPPSSEFSSNRRRK